MQKLLLLSLVCSAALAVQPSEQELRLRKPAAVKVDRQKQKLSRDQAAASISGACCTAQLIVCFTLMCKVLGTTK